MTVEFTLVPPRNRKVNAAEHPPKRAPLSCQGRVPRVARLMALAIKFQDMIDRGEIRDYAELARLGYVSRARVTQIMNLLNLAPNIQEEILFLPPAFGRGPVTERHLRQLNSIIDWSEQRRLWGERSSQFWSAYRRSPALVPKNALAASRAATPPRSVQGSSSGERAPNRGSSRSSPPSPTE